MTFTCTKCGNYSDDGDFEACICLRCIDNGAGKEQEQRKWHHIDAPAVRSLNPNEQKVYSLLRMGYTPKEVARQLHMPYGDEFFCNVHDVTCDTVRHLITSIREKGWEISENEDEEDKDVAKYTEKQKEKVYKLYDEGKTPKEISIKMKLPYKSVWKWCDTYKKKKQFEQNIEEGSNAELADDFDPCEMMLAETPPVVVNADTDIDALEKAWAEYEAKKEPAQAATCTDSESESFGKESTDIIPENLPIVKERYFSDDTCEAVKDKLHLLYAEIDEVSNRMRRKYEAIEKINASIAEDDAICSSIQFRIDELEADLVIIAGGVIGE